MEDAAGPTKEAILVGTENSEGRAAYSQDFYIYSFKVVPCTASYAHNWSLCPFVHPNEKARRRDPRLHTYEPLPCPFDKKGANCPHGDNCTYTHNVYEYWLHPKRFRTQMCQQGAACKRPLCFFAHNLQELRSSDGQLQRPCVAPPAQEQPAAALAAAAAAAQAGLLPADAQQQQQQQSAAAAAAAMGYVPALVPYGLMPAGAGAASLPPLQPCHVPSAAAAGSAGGLPQARALASPSQQQQGWVSGYMTPQGSVVLSSGYQAQVMPGTQFAAGTDYSLAGGQQQQQQYQYQQQQQQQQQYLAASAQWQHRMGGAAGLPPGSAGMEAALQLNPALMGSQYQMVPDEQVLLGQPGGIADSSSSFLVSQQQHAAQQGLAAAGVSGSQYSWNLQSGVGPSTTSASVSFSHLSMPTVVMSSTASVPGSSNNSLSHNKPGQPGAVSLDVLQATMQQMSIRDCHVRDL